MRSDTATFLDATAKGSVSQVVAAATAVMHDLLRLALDVVGVPGGAALPTAPLPPRPRPPGLPV